MDPTIFARRLWWFVESVLGVGIVLGATVLAVQEFVAAGAISAVLGVAVLASTLLGTVPFVAGRWSTDWLGGYLLGFVIGLFVVALADLAIGVAPGNGVAGETSRRPMASVLLAHLAGAIAVHWRDVELRKRPAVAPAD